jgi:hypothetical protein
MTSLASGQVSGPHWILVIFRGPAGRAGPGLGSDARVRAS